MDTASIPLSSSQPIDASMWIYLWDIVDEGYDAPLSFLKERGLTALSMASAYHAGKFLAPHNPKRKVVFLEDGTIFFKPDVSRFGKITPVTHSLVHEGHDLGAVKEHAERYGLETRAWVVCCHNSRIGNAFSSACTETAFGDKLIHNLCPNNADVREYLRGLITSIAAQGIGTIELEALQFQGYSHGMHHEREGIPLPLGVRYLLGLCFCPSCLHAARSRRVDIDAVRQWTIDKLNRYFADPALYQSMSSSLEMLPSDLFAPFDSWREDCVRDTAAELAESAATFGAVLRPMTSIDPVAQRLTAMNPAKVAQATGGMLALGYIKDGPVLRAPLAAVKKQVAAHQLTVGMHVGMPESGGKREFLERVATARALGINRFNFYNYGFVPLSYLDWIPTALA